MPIASQTILALIVSPNKTEQGRKAPRRKIILLGLFYCVNTLSQQKHEVPLMSQKELFKAILSCSNAQELQDFLEDLCTPNELESISERWQVARLLEEEIPYREIYERTGVSTATVTRVARALKEGCGYRNVLKRQNTTQKKKGS
jgi:TrpR-related protein YerC/YecD